MPRNEYSSNFALMSDFDARYFNGTLYTRKDHSNVTKSIALNSSGLAVFDDALSFLTGLGRASNNSLTYLLETDTPAGVWSSGIDSNDKIFIEETSGTVAGFDITIDSGDGTRWGIEDNYWEWVAGLATNNHAPNDWQRGIFYFGQSVYFADRLGMGSPINAYYPQLEVPALQDIPSIFKERSGTNVYCLQAAEETAVGVANRAGAAQWLLDDNGHVMQVVNTNPTYGNQHARSFTWSDYTFRDRLGYTGNESWTQVSDHTWKLVADLPCPGVLIPSRPLTDNHKSFDRVVDFKRKIGGGYVTNFVGNYVKTSIEFYLDATADIKNEYNHFTHVCGDYFYLGAKVSLYQDWGDSRLSIRNDQVRTTSYNSYSASVTSEGDGSNGVIRGFLTQVSNDLAYPGSIRRRVPVKMEIEHA
jgi:hypothetical protein